MPIKGSIFRRAGWVCVSALTCSLSSSQLSITPEQHNLVAPLFIVNEQMTSVLTIKNDEDASVQVRVEFNSLEGEDIAHRILSVPGRSESRIDLDSVQMPSHRFEDLGSIEVAAIGKHVSGWVTIASRTGTTPPVDERLQIVTKQQELPAAAIPSKPMSVPVVALHSWSTSPQLVSVTCSDVEGRTYESEMTLPPRMTLLVNACITGRVDARSYKQLMKGDIGKAIRPTKIGIRIEGSPQGIAAWGLAATTTRDSLATRMVGIEFAAGEPVRSGRNGK